jgi:hypothetical protein
MLSMPFFSFLFLYYHIVWAISYLFFYYHNVLGNTGCWLQTKHMFIILSPSTVLEQQAGIFVSPLCQFSWYHLTHQTQSINKMPFFSFLIPPFHGRAVSCHTTTGGCHCLSLSRQVSSLSSDSADHSLHNTLPSGHSHNTISPSRLLYSTHTTELYFCSNILQFVLSRHWYLSHWYLSLFSPAQILCHLVLHTIRYHQVLYSTLLTQLSSIFAAIFCNLYFPDTGI